MHRDVKLGLALGILIIGFAAAFCFPRQPATELAVSPVTGLKLAAIDEEIRLERRRTFVGEELNPPEQPTLADALAAPTPIDSGLPPLQTAAMREQAAQRSAPDPISRETPLPIDPPTAVTELFVQAPAEAPVVEPAVEETWYTVQPGDTLSAVAAQTLGSSRKYEAIYEANRDVMATPNSLQIGMKLRIPQESEAIARRTPDTTNPVANRTGEPMRASIPQATNPEPLARRNMFSPVRPRSLHARSGDSIAR